MKIRGVMKGDATIIKHLNVILKNELTAITSISCQDAEGLGAE